MYQLPGHTLARAEIAAESVIEGDRLVTVFPARDGFPASEFASEPVADVVLETPFIARFELADGSVTRRYAGIAPVLRVTVLRSVPLTDD
jgi:hypothetical protein